MVGIANPVHIHADVHVRDQVAPRKGVEFVPLGEGIDATD
jgi:hypothetical protein